MEQLDSRLGAVGVGLSSDILDRIDEMVPPGTTFRPVRPSARPTPAGRRRRCRTISAASPLICPG